MKRYILFAIVLGIAIAQFCDKIGFNIIDWQFWVIIIPLTFFGIAIYLSLKEK